MPNKKTLNALDELILAENWEIRDSDNSKTVVAFGQTFPYAHPVAIHNKIYRNDKKPETRYHSMVKIHHYYWPHLIETWNYWQEEIYFAHCENWKFISLAAGASAGKSQTAAEIVTIQQFSDPENNAAIVASTTLQALNKRIMGYIVRLVHDCVIPLPFHYTKSPTPQIMFNKTDEIHCISALAAGVGTDETHIRNYIGRHPRKKLILVLDEAPDLSPFVLGAVSNLEAGEEGKLQIISIGNSKDKSDLHGALSTPANGWKSVSHETHTKWRTTQHNGVCLYFSPYRSPAIHETDPVKKEKLSKFLITKEAIEANKNKYGANSIDFWRMTLGWWLEAAGNDTTFTSGPFLENFRATRKSLWSGLRPLKVIAGFDPAFSTGGDKAVLRLGILGQADNGQVILDFRDESLLFRLKMEAQHRDPLDIQLAKQIIDILRAYNVQLQDVCFDVTGQGRTFPELVRLQAAQQGIHWLSGLKIWHARSSQVKSNQPDCIVKSPTELWENMRSFIQTQQIAGLDAVAAYQLSTRLRVRNKKTNKIELENKESYRARMSAINPGQGTSPDEADAAALCLFMAVHRHGFHLEQTQALDKKPDFFSEKFAALQREQAIEREAKRKYPLIATFRGAQGIRLKGPGRF